MSHQSHTDETWARIRDDFLAGDTMEQVCARYDIGPTTFKDRARTEGWRRRDQPMPTDVSLEKLQGFADMTHADMFTLASMRLAQAMALGRSAEASRWMRLQDRLMDQQRTRMIVSARAAAATASTEAPAAVAPIAEPANPANSAIEFSAPAATPLNRQQRRRLERQNAREPPRR